MQLSLPATVNEKYSATYWRMLDKYQNEALAELHTLKALKLSGISVKGLQQVQTQLIEDMLGPDVAAITKYLKSLRSFNSQLLYVGQDDRGLKQLLYGTYKLTTVRNMDYARALDSSKFVPSKNKPPQLIRPVKALCRGLAKSSDKNGWYPLSVKGTIRWYALLAKDGLLLRYEVDFPSNFLVVPKNLLLRVWKKL